MGGFIKTQIAGPHHGDSDSVGLRAHPIICISNTFSCNVDATGPRTTLVYRIAELKSDYHEISLCSLLHCFSDSKIFVKYSFSPLSLVNTL